MKLYILRHGQAPSADEAGVATDAERPLSPRGREDARRAAAYMNEHGAKPSLILVSPFKRARQTGQEAAQTLTSKPEVRTYGPLANQMAGMDVYRRLVEDDLGAEELMLIGHQPQVGEITNYLTGKFFQFLPAGQVAVETDGPGKSRLLWHVNPDELR